MKKKKSVSFAIAGLLLFAALMILLIIIMVGKMRTDISVGIIRGADGTEKEHCRDYQPAMDGHRSIYSQLTVMAKKREVWVGNIEYADEICRYAVADLDHNGRYEIMISNHGGTGLYTYTRFFEINESFDGLTECETNFTEGDSQPDIIFDTKLKTYIDDSGQYHYAVYDMLKNGAAEYYEYCAELMLKNGKIILSPIAYRTTLYDPQAVTCKDAAGNDISEEEYENAPRTYFNGYKETVTCLGWQDVKELDADTEQAIKQLQASQEIYAKSTQERESLAEASVYYPEGGLIKKT